jgi:uncharacterized protein with HEPN domain
MRKDPKIFLGHIIESIEAIEQHTKGTSKDDFFKNIMVQDAVIRRIEIMGEAVKNLPPDYKRNHSEIEWREITGMRDKLIHEYFGADINVVWQTIKKDIPYLKKQISELLEKFSKAEDNQIKLKYDIN